MAYRKSKSQQYSAESLGLTDLEFHQLRKYAEDVKKAYVHLRRLKYSSQFKLDTSTWSEDFWIGVARFMQQHALDLDAWVTFVFNKFPSTWPTPNQLKCKAYAREFAGDEIAQQLRQERANILVAHNNATVARELRYGTPVSEILRDDTLSLTPVFSYCLARSSGLDSAAEELAPDARRYLAAHPQFVWTPLRAFLPPEWLHAVCTPSQP